MTEITPAQLRQQARKYELLAQQLRQTADLMEGLHSGGEPTDQNDAELLSDKSISPVQKTRSVRIERGTAGRGICIAAARIGATEGFVKLADVVREASEPSAPNAQPIPKPTVYAFFKREFDEYFEEGDAGSGLYKVRDCTWVFSYGIGMSDAFLRPQFKRFGQDYDSAVRGAVPATLAGARLSWRNDSSKWLGATATFEDDDSRELDGVAYLIQNRALEVFDKWEHPAYARSKDTRKVSFANGQVITAWVYNVVDQRRMGEDGTPSRKYLQEMIESARRLQLSDLYIESLERLL